MHLLLTRKMAEVSFRPKWNELLKPVQIPDEEFRSECIPPSFMHSVYQFEKIVEDSNVLDKIRYILDKRVVATLPDVQNIQKDSEILDQLGINILPEAANSDKDSKPYVEECVIKIFKEITLKDLVKYTVMIYTREINPREFETDNYKRFVKRLVEDFLASVGQGPDAEQIITSHLFHKVYQADREGFINVKFSNKIARYIVNGVVNDFINAFVKKDELHRLIELLFIKSYDMPAAICSVLEDAYIKIILETEFYEGVKGFVTSPYYESAKHGLQKQSRKVLLTSILMLHVNLLMEVANKYSTNVDKELLRNILFLTVCRVLSLPGFSQW